MTDQEMLELAAKGRGYRVRGWRDGRLYVVDPDNPAENFDPFWWQPDEDDGDALRLAVDLGLKIDIDDGEHGCTTVGRVCNLSLCEHDGFADKHAATRRAIVMAAAEIGRDV